MARQPSPAPFDGALVIDKPKGKTSHDVVDAVRHLAGFRQIGHLGTLDPLATGVLVLLLGRATRLVQFYSGRRKRYAAGFRFGFATDSYDSDGQAQGPDAPPALHRELLERLAAERVGRFEQMPPAFSAKKIHGRPAYELARKKQVVELKAVEVELFEYQLTEIEGSIARFVIECSSGTYIRSLAHEMGLPLLAKDLIKETLMSVLTVSDVAASREIGQAAIEVVYAVARASSTGAILEANFHRSASLGGLQGLPGPVVEVFCRCDREIALARYRERSERRHPGHFDLQRTDDELWNDEVTTPVAGGWAVLEIDTTQHVNISAVVRGIEVALGSS